VYQATAPRRTILVVDDSEPARELVYWSLGGPSSIFQLIPAESAARAFSLLEDAKVDLIIADYHMPDTDGVEFVHRLRHDTRLHTIPVIMISSDYDDAWRREAGGAGVGVFLDKPFSPSDLMAAIDDALAENGPAARLASGQLTVQTLLDSIPFLAMILDENHRVIMGNKTFFDLEAVGIGDCTVECASAVHGDAGVPGNCPLVEAATTGASAEHVVQDHKLGPLRVAVFPLDITTEDGRRLFLHIARPTD